MRHELSLKCLIPQKNILASNLLTNSAIKIARDLYMARLVHKIFTFDLL
jgi:hypothetical protein